MITTYPDRKLKVAQVMGFMDGGGVESVVMDYCTHIDKEQIQSDFFVCEGSRHIPYERIERLGGRVFVVPTYKHPFAYMSALRKIFEVISYDIVHVHMSTLSVFALAVAWSAGVPVRISHSHTTYSICEGPRVLMKFLLRPFAGLFATDLLACGKLAGEWLFGKRNMSSGRVTVMPNAINIRRFTFDGQIRKKARASLGIGDMFAVGHIGRFMPQKNHMFLLEIFKEIKAMEPRAVLLLAGDGKLFDDVRAKVLEMGLSDCVKFLGWHEGICRLYQAMDVLVLPSLFEGLPLVSVEAQSMGLSCFLSDKITDEAVITPNAQRLSLKLSPKEWAEAVLSAKDSSRVDMSDKISNAGFDIKQAAACLSNMYMEMAERSRGDGE